MFQSPYDYLHVRINIEVPSHSIMLAITISVQTDCGNGMTSYGKRRRRAVGDVMMSHDDVMEEVPLQLEIIVKTPVNRNETSPIPQIAVEGKFY